MTKGCSPSPLGSRRRDLLEGVPSGIWRYDSVRDDEA